MDDGINLNGDIVTGNHVLRRDLQRHSPQADPEQLVHTRDDKYHPWSLSPDQSSQTEDNASLIFPKDFDGRGGNDNEKDDQKKRLLARYQP